MKKLFFTFIILCQYSKHKVEFKLKFRFKDIFQKQEHLHFLILIQPIISLEADQAEPRRLAEK